MAVLPVGHPDILDFIACKQKEGDIANFNLSVAVTDDFMRAAAEPGGKAMHKLISPASGQVVKEVSARELMDAIARHALENGEPGLLFIDEINRKNPCKHLYTIESTNPCVTGDTLVKTSLGYKPVTELLGSPFAADVFGIHYPSGDHGFFFTGRKAVHELQTFGGHSLKLTRDHRVLLENGTWVAAEDLREGDHVQLDDGMIASFRRLEDLGREEDVFDCVVQGAHAFSANGIVVHNCGEQALGPFESCNLGSINLARHVVLLPSNLFGHIDWALLQDTVGKAVRFLDNVITVNNLPHPRLRQASWASRRIGLGFMGLADMLYATGFSYGSPLSIDLTEQVAEFIQYHAMLASVKLAVERGPFPAIKGSCFDPERFTWVPPCPACLIIDSHRPPLDWPALIESIKRNGIRNAALTTVAPTGTIATVAGVEGYGIEPVFSLSHARYVIDQATGERKPFFYTSALFERACNLFGLPEGCPVRERVLATGSCRDVAEELPPGVAEVFVTSGDLSAEKHVRMQAAVQRYFCNSISKTINLPPSADLGAAIDAIFLAWRFGCRGITLYKTGSRETEVLVSGKK
jgi:ribonucleoside-diphosphate reductase alpha chain